MTEKQEHTELPGLIGDPLEALVIDLRNEADSYLDAAVFDTAEILTDAADAITDLNNANIAMLEALEMAVSYGWEHESALDAIRLGRGEE